MSQCCNAQNLHHSQLLIQLRPSVRPGVFTESFGIAKDKFKEINSNFRIYTIDCESENNLELLQNRLIQSGTCQSVQKLNEVRSRSVVPNDPFFAQQKYITKIQAQNTWPYLRNGTTRKGDTLVVAIVDSGMDTAHPDLLPNRWVNYHEIPGNQIDDDSNGYVDDIYGWNGGEEDGRTYTKITLDAHGTGIAGEIGASGNNGEGVAGINWKIKLMPVVCYPEKGNGSDIGVIRSLIYVFDMKKLYLKTKGLKGANIVAVNTSIGIDLAFPQDAPIWCSLYDSLGSVGILSAAATTNNDYDVGVKGDIPSTCESPFLLVVNSTNVNDERMNSGFSNIHLDLASTGDKNFTTTLVKNSGANGPYTDFSGTSFAAPLVAGTAALLYQQVCDTFLYLALNMPDSAVRLMSRWIMDGTDKLSVLKNKCVSGGRLNTYNAWQQMNTWCSAHDKYYSTAESAMNFINVYPNPVKQGNDIHINLNQVPDRVKINLYSPEGRILLSTENMSESLNIFPTSLLSTGFFILEIKTGQTRLVKKLLIY